MSVDVDELNFNRVTKNSYKQMKSDEITEFAKILINAGWYINPKTYNFVSIPEQKIYNLTVYTNVLSGYDETTIIGGLKQLNNDSGLKKYLKENINPSLTDIKINLKDDATNKSTNNSVKSLKPFQPNTNMGANTNPNITDLVKMANKLNGGNCKGDSFGGDYLPLNATGNNKQSGGSLTCSDSLVQPLTNIIIKLRKNGQMDDDTQQNIEKQFKAFKKQEDDLIKEIKDLIENAKLNMSGSDNPTFVNQIKQLLGALGTTRDGFLKLLMDFTSNTSMSNAVPINSLLELKPTNSQTYTATATI
jgi:hypothetical protein